MMVSKSTEQKIPKMQLRKRSKRYQKTQKKCITERLKTQNLPNLAPKSPKNAEKHKKETKMSKTNRKLKERKKKAKTQRETCKNTSLNAKNTKFVFEIGNLQKQCKKPFNR